MFGYNDPSTITIELLCTSFVHLKVHLQKRTKKNAESIDFSAFFEFCLSENESYIPIPPIPPMPPIPPGGIAGPDSFSSGLSATIASVVINKPAIEAAS